MTITTGGTTRRAVLDLLKRRGPTEAGDLAAALGVTHVGVRRHLDALVADGLVTSRQERRKVGRPVALYHLTGAGDETFVRRYPEVAEAALHTVATLLGPDAADRVFATYFAAALPFGLRGTAPDEATGALARAQDDAGFMAEATPLDEHTALLVERNCPLRRLAQRWPQACAAELSALRDALGDGMSVDRVKHQLAGDHTCTYLVRRRAV